MNTYTWTISALDCKVSEDNLQDVVYTVHWRYKATNEDGISAETYGAQYILPPTEEDFTPYSELTKEQVTGWIEDILDITAMQLALEANIELQINPINVTLLPPFEN